MEPDNLPDDILKDILEETEHIKKHATGTIKFRVQGQILHALRSTLSARSSVFHDLFYKVDILNTIACELYSKSTLFHDLLGELDVIWGDDGKTIDLPGENYWDILVLFYILHVQPVLRPWNVYSMMPLLCKYKCQKSIENSVDFICNSPENFFKTTEDIGKMSALADTCNLEKLKEKCQVFRCLEKLPNKVFQEVLLQIEDMKNNSTIKFRVQGKILYAISHELNCRSVVMRGIFDEYKVDWIGDGRIIDLPGEDFVNMLIFFYVLQVDYCVRPWNVHAVMPLLHKYKCNCCIKNSVDFICHSPLEFFKTAEDIQKMLSLAEMYGLEKLKKKCIDLLCFAKLFNV